MIKIFGTSIEMTRGDSLIVTVEIYDEQGQPYTPDEGDTVRFALKSSAMTLGRKDFKDPSPLVIKTIPTDTLVLQLVPADTKGLAFGDYVYDIELTHANGIVDTFIADARFIIRPEVH